MMNGNKYITKDFIFDSAVTSQIEYEVPSLYKFPVVYIIYSLESSKAYIGETTNVSNRLKNHLANPDKNHLENLKVILSPYFNKSAVLDIEANMIKYMSADEKFKLLNGNEGISNHLYYQKDEYFEIFKAIWEELKFAKLVNKDIFSIQNSDLFKYSPFKALSESQNDAIITFFRDILDINHQTTFIEGSAGTGKTILAVYIIKLLLTEVDEYDINENEELSELITLAKKVKTKMLGARSNLKLALVVPMTSLRDTLKKVFKTIHGLSSNMVIGPSEVKNETYDLLIVDEAHRLRQRKNITNYKSFDDTNKFYGLDSTGTELDWIVRSSKKQILFYDEHQSIRPSDVSKDKFSELKTISLTIQLQSQMRVEGGENYISFVNSLLTCKNDIMKWESAKYELKLFTSLKNMIHELEKREIDHGLCRTISGYSWEWKSKDSPNEPDITIDGIDLYWNRESKNWINSTTSLREMGCIHTTQGYDLNYAGIIFGKEITYDEDSKRIIVISRNYFDKKGKAGIEGSDLHDYIINIYKTIMYRGIKGTYLYCYHKELENYFRQYIECI